MDERGSDGTPSSLVGPRIVAAILVLGGAFLIYSSLSIRQPAGFSAVGPSAIPLVVSIGLVVLGLLLAVRTTLRPDADYGEDVGREERTTHWPTVGLLILALVVYALALNGFRLGPIAVPGAGYIIATGLFVPAAARGGGRRPPPRPGRGGGGLVGTVLAFGLGWSWNGLFALAIVRRNANAPAVATGIVQTTKYVGGTVGPLSFGVAVAQLGYAAAWAGAAVLLGLGAALILLGRALLHRS
jgi:hypothetical protein